MSNCERHAQRLIEGERPEDDAALGTHIRSCLACFRLVADLRDVPRLRQRLMDSAAAAPTPGDAFFEALPGRVWHAVQVERVPVRRTRRVAVWSGLGLGAAAALALLFVGKAPPSFEPRPSPPLAVADDRPIVPTDVLDLDEGGLRALLGQLASQEGEIEDFIRDVEDEGSVLSPVVRIENLDAETLRSLAASLEKPI